MQLWGKTCLIFHSPQTNDMSFCWFMVILYVFPTKNDIFCWLAGDSMFFSIGQKLKESTMPSSFGSFPRRPKGVSLRTSVLGQSTLSLVILGDRPNRSGNSGKFSRVTLW